MDIIINTFNRVLPFIYLNIAHNIAVFFPTHVTFITHHQSALGLQSMPQG